MHFMQCLIMLYIKLISYNGVIFIAIIIRAGQLYRCRSFLKQRYVLYTNLGFVQHQSMIVFFIQELPLLILLICSPKLNSHVHLFFNHSLTVEMLGIGL